MFNGDNSGLYMPVAPAYAGGGNFGNGFLGGDGIWALLIFALIFNGGFGGFGGWGGWGMGGMMGMGMMDGWGLYPWLNNSEHISDGFRDQQLSTQVGNIQNAITSGFGDVQLGIAGVNQNICQTGNGIVSAVNGAQNAISQQLYTNQISDLERSFAAQTANTAAINALQAQQANCCCENRAATADLKYTIATENCADRAAVTDGVRDILANQTAGIQRILDQMCADKIDAKNDEIAQLRQEVLFARGQASQIAQNQQVIDGIYNRLDTCPVGTTPVYGRTPIFSCNNNCGCGNNF